MDEKSIYLKCSCGSEVLSISKMDGEHYLYIYTQNPKYTLWNRLRMIWKIIKTGNPYEDQIVLSEESMKSLKEWI